MNHIENKETLKTISGSNSEQKPRIETNKQETARKSSIERPVKINKRLLLESGVHFGHKTKDWNPKAFKYLYGIHNDIHVINLSETLRLWAEVRKIVVDIVSEGMDILFVGTKKQASNIIKEEAIYCGQHYVDKKWKGGTLTNLKTMRDRVNRLEYLEKLLSDEDQLSRYVKKEKLLFEKEKQKLEESIGGIRSMTYYPGLLFVIDINKENIAVKEAHKLGIPVLGLLDSNCNPDDLDFFIPCNDDAYKSIRLFTSALADAVLEGKEIAAQKQQTGLEVSVEDLTYSITEDDVNLELNTSGENSDITTSEEIITGSDTIDSDTIITDPDTNITPA